MSLTYKKHASSSSITTISINFKEALSIIYKPKINLILNNKIIKSYPQSFSGGLF